MPFYLQLSYMCAPRKADVATGRRFVCVGPGLRVSLLGAGAESEPSQAQGHSWGQCPHPNKMRMDARRRDQHLSPMPASQYSEHFEFSILHLASPAGTPKAWPFASLNDCWFPGIVKFSIMLLINSLPTVVIFLCATLHSSTFSSTRL